MAWLSPKRDGACALIDRLTVIDNRFALRLMDLVNFRQVENSDITDQKRRRNQTNAVAHHIC
jgi:hypothetical protein